MVHANGRSASTCPEDLVPPVANGKAAIAGQGLTVPLAQADRDAPRAGHRICGGGDRNRSRFLFRVNGKHIWNPAAFAIVVLPLASGGMDFNGPMGRRDLVRHANRMVGGLRPFSRAAR